MGFEACGYRYCSKPIINIISHYNLAHNEIGDCCGVFNVLDEQGLIHCNECNKTMHEAMDEYALQCSGYERELPFDLASHPDTEADGIVFCGKCGKIK